MKETYPGSAVRIRQSYFIKEEIFIQERFNTELSGIVASPSSVGTYGLIEASEYLRLPYNTVSNWTKKHKLVLMPECHRLSFFNLVELHVLKGMRIRHRVPLQRIRRAIEHVRERFASEHPLAEYRFETDGIDLFLEHAGDYINVSRHGQLGIKGVLSTYIHRIDWDNKSGLANQLFPFVVNESEKEPRAIVLNPRISFGRPVIFGTGISTAVIAGRFNARDSVPDLAEEYGLKEAQIEEAIRWESRPKRAA